VPLGILRKATALRRTFLDPDGEHGNNLRSHERVKGADQSAEPNRASEGRHYDGVQWDRVMEILSAVNGVWTVPILRHLASGKSRPADLLAAIVAESEGRLTAKVMFDTLKRLVNYGLVIRRTVASFPRETYYWLSPFGHEILTEVSKLGAPDSRRAEYMGYGQEDPQPPPGVDRTVPNPARIWNYTIGGRDNFAADRQAAAAVLDAMPSLVLSARLFRRFQGDAVRLLLGRGVRQFLDIGTGLPVWGAVHEVAQGEHAESRVVYVDNDPVVMAHARAMLNSTPEGACAFVHADLREPGKILAQAAETLDLAQPTAVILLAVLHFIPDEEDPWGIVRRLMDGIGGTGYLVIGHAGSDIDSDRAIAAASRYNERSPTRVRLRSHAEVERFFMQAGATLLEPGVATLSDWWSRQGIEDDSVPPGVNGHIGIGWRQPR
jgi:DNA-binding HxlR family transcriptional regulator